MTNSDDSARRNFIVKLTLVQAAIVIVLVLAAAAAVPAAARQLGASTLVQRGLCWMIVVPWLYFPGRDMIGSLVETLSSEDRSGAWRASTEFIAIVAIFCAIPPAYGKAGLFRPLAEIETVRLEQVKNRLIKSHATIEEFKMIAIRGQERRSAFFVIRRKGESDEIRIYDPIGEASDELYDLRLRFRPAPIRGVRFDKARIHKDVWDAPRLLFKLVDLVDLDNDDALDVVGAFGPVTYAIPGASADYRPAEPGVMRRTDLAGAPGGTKVSISIDGFDARLPFVIHSSHKSTDYWMAQLLPTPPKKALYAFSPFEPMEGGLEAYSSTLELKNDFGSEVLPVGPVGDVRVEVNPVSRDSSFDAENEPSHVVVSSYPTGGRFAPDSVIFWGLNFQVDPPIEHICKRKHASEIFVGPGAMEGHDDVGDIARKIERYLATCVRDSA